jgi:hypothetical protein
MNGLRATTRAFMALLALVQGCDHGAMTQSSTESPLNAVAAADWDWLAGQRVFFGHQSVGQNVVDGIRDVLADHPEIGLRLVGTQEPEVVTGPAFIHALVGRNGDVFSKTREFRAILREAREPVAIAFHKYCYVDVGFGTNPDSLFKAYQEGTEAARAQGLTIVHVTMPLTTTESGLRGFVKQLLHRGTQVELNAIRNRYNELLRDHYRAKEPVFDLAALESTRVDGGRSFSLAGSDTVYSLAPEYTSDGGHLNAIGRRRVAEALLAFLARLRREAPGAAGS